MHRCAQAEAREFLVLSFVILCLIILRQNLLLTKTLVFLSWVAH